MAIKLVIGLKNGKSFQKELSKDESESLYGRVLGETINGESLSFQGTEFTITGGSDYTGIPMRKDLPGQNRKRILTTKGIGFNGKINGRSFKGVRKKKTYSGSVVYEKTHQLNLKCVKGEKIIEDNFKPAEEEKKAE